MADYTGTNNNDTIVANGQDDTMTGLRGDDYLDGNDELKGRGGNDYIVGGAGADNIKGNNGTDTLSYEGSDAGVTVDLGARTASGGHAEGDKLADTIENLTGSSHDDTLTGSSGNNVLTGGAGNDSLDGGAGTDTAVFTGNLADYPLIAENGVITVTDLRGGANDGVDVLVNFESLQFADQTITVDQVNNRPVTGDDASAAAEDNAVTITVLGNDSDPDGDALSVTGAANGTNGTTVVNPDGTITYTPNADFNGTDTFTYTISDGNGGTDTATVTVVVAAQNDGPTAADESTATSEDNAVTVTVLANDSDIEGDTLSVTGATNGTNGTTVVNPDGTITYTPNADFNGTDSFSYTISDGNGGTDTATVSVTINAVNDGPVATDDGAATNEDNAVTVTVLGNDSDIEGDTLSVTGATNGTNGTTVVNPDGTITYTPNADFYGTDSFTYTISDGNGGTDTATVSVTINAVNNGPVAADDSAAVNEDNAVTVTVLGNDSDVEGDALSVTGATNGTNGTTVVNPDGTITYTPNADFYGTDTFTYTISDGNGGADTATVTVVVAAQNDGPVATDDRVTATEDMPLTIDALANDTDLDGDTLSVTGVNQGANGTVSVNPDGTILYTPDADYFGTDAFTYTISDGNGGTSVARIDVTVEAVNDAPIAADDLAVTDEDAAVSVDVLLNDTDDAGGGMGQSGQGSLNVTGATDGANGVVTVNPDGTVTYTPDAGWAGNDSFTYTVTDDGGATATATVDVTVNAVDDILTGTDLAETMIGGAGRDTANYASSDAGVSVDLNSGLGSGGHAAGDSLVDVEDIVGSGHNDSLKAGAGVNNLSGGAGNDWLNGGAGGDVLDGGADVDWVNYGGSGAGVTVNLGLGTGTGGDADGDTLSSIENIWGSAHNDVFVGDAGNNWFYGGDGADSFDGGDGVADTATYAGAATGITVNLGLGIGQGGQAEGDTFANIEHIRATAHADILTGSAANNWLFGAEGDDTLEGGAGGDSLDGGDGIDTATYASSLGWVGIDLTNGTGWNSDARYDVFNSIENIVGSNQGDDMRGSAAANVFTGGLGDDWLMGRGGGDTLQGGSGFDWATYMGSAAGVIVSLATGLGTGGDAEGDSLFDIENLWRSDNADTLTGDAGENWLYGAGGGDALDGGAGNDTASYRHSASGITVDLGAGTGAGGDAQGDTFTNIENVRATEYGDTLTGDAGSNWLFGAGGNDTLDGGAGGDVLTGGLGTDTLSYAGAAAGVTVDLQAGTAAGGDAAGDSFSGFENLTGSASADALTGNTGANVLTGGAGSDTASYAGSSAAVLIDLSAGSASGGDAAGDVLTDIKNVTGSDHNDTLTGDTGANVLTGGAGDDILIGGAGSDTLAGGAGTDTVSYLASASAVSASLATGAGSGGDANGDTYTGIENVTGSALNDTLTGDGGANALSGQDGNDWITGGAGADALDGGAGTDWASYSGSAAGVTVSLAAGTGSGGDAQGDTLTGIENVWGSAQADTLTDDAGGNWLVGGAGADVIDGGAGGDVLSFSGSASGVTVDLALGTGTGGDAQGDTYFNVESIRASEQGDTLTGSAANNWLYGAGGNDVISGGLGNDTMVGGTGNDTYNFARGDGADTVDNRGRAVDADTLQFGSGIAHDQLWFEQSGNDLVISVIGEDGTVKVTDWFSGSDNTIASIETATGDTLDVTGVNNLVTSMSAFSAPTGPAEDMPQPIRDALAVDLAANWQ